MKDSHIVYDIVTIYNDVHCLGKKELNEGLIKP